jgi:hypothetical protein
MRKTDKKSMCVFYFSFAQMHWTAQPGLLQPFAGIAESDACYSGRERRISTASHARP